MTPFAPHDPFCPPARLTAELADEEAELAAEEATGKVEA